MFTVWNQWDLKVDKWDLKDAHTFGMNEHLNESQDTLYEYWVRTVCLQMIIAFAWEISPHQDSLILSDLGS